MGFFVNAAGGRQDPIVIGQSEKPQCFKTLKDARHPYKCHYFANKKLWIIAQNGQLGQGKFGPRLLKIAIFQRSHHSNSQRIIEFFSNFGKGIMQNRNWKERLSEVQRA